jgi:cyclic pyranopterin phosphate synthase
MSERLTHLDETGRARMVDVAAKPETERAARAAGSVRMRRETLQLALSGNAKKGDVRAVCELAGVMAAKRTAELIPLCHPIPLTDVQVKLAPDESLPGFVITATAQTRGRTGVEMEALTAVSVACLTLYDMLKGVDRDMTIEGVRLLEKSGGASGDYHRGA